VRFGKGRKSDGKSHTLTSLDVTLHTCTVETGYLYSLSVRSFGFINTIRDLSQDINY